MSVISSQHRPAADSDRVKAPALALAQRLQQAESELAQSQRMLNTLLGCLSGMAYRGGVAPDRPLTFVSDGCQLLTGLSARLLTDAGASRYGCLIHPEDRDSVWQQLCQALQQRQPYQIVYRLITASDTEKWVKEQGRGVYSSDATPLALEGLITDVTKSRGLARKLAYQAAHDDLTGLVNRREFEERVNKALAHTKHFGTTHALCYLDLDQFKIINDTVGHRAGDELLRQVAGLLSNKLRGRDTLARLGGDEFGLLLENCPLSAARQLAESMVDELHEFRFVWERRIFQIGVSIGLVMIGPDAENTEQLLSRADIACYAAKDLGRNRVHVYQTEDADLARRQSELQRVSHLREALEYNQLQLYCQPIRALNPSAQTSQPHYEILLRMIDQNGNLLPPGAFIPAAERYGLMESIDKWVVQTVLENFCRLFGNANSAQIAINLSGNSLNNESLLDFVKQQLSLSAARPSQICFEITETAVVSNLGQATRFIAEMKRLGCRFALDDFGSGLSSFAYLKYFPVDYLKIDGGFVRDMADDPTDHAMVAAINQVGHVMGIKTIAEYAESDAVIEALKTIGVDYAQGYAVGEPLPLVLDQPIRAKSAAAVAKIMATAEADSDAGSARYIADSL